tara:strand:+ start:2431 stop:2670 length:240 start_codon:yes stop_codon:yes gene_type:complete
MGYLCCTFCETETVYICKFCDDCRIIKNIGNVYGFKEIKNILESVCIRNAEQKQRKIKVELKKEIESKKIYGDESYIKK